MSCLFAEQALLPGGWERDVRIEFGEDGVITAVEVGASATGGERACGPVVPGMPDLHSHAFQRAMAGLAERRGAGSGSGGDTFWTWREAMYGLLARLEPEQIHAVAAQLYAELLVGGFTSVAEFHYLHNAPDGTPYADPAETSVQVVEAARRTGIGITHLPVLYERGGFDGAPLRDAQLRVRADADAIAAIAERLRAAYERDPNVRVGLALHSLRAVGPESLGAAVAAVHAADDTAPVHIHVAEQTVEVEDCVAATGQRPVEWLLDHAAPDARWCLVHATHLTGDETERLAASGSVTGLCPTTEANLGDGVFPLPPFLERAGRFGIGTDSHVSRSVAEELRTLEYGQRLVHRRRNLATSDARPSVGGTLYAGATAGGAQALAQPVGALAIGERADLVALDGKHPDFEGLTGDALLDVYVFGGGERLVRDVMVGGRWVVREGCHIHAAEIGSGFRRVLATLRS